MTNNLHSEPASTNGCLQQIAQLKIQSGYFTPIHALANSRLLVITTDKNLYNDHEKILCNPEVSKFLRQSNLSLNKENILASEVFANYTIDDRLNPMAYTYKLYFNDMEFKHHEFLSVDYSIDKAGKLGYNLLPGGLSKYELEEMPEGSNFKLRLDSLDINTVFSANEILQLTGIKGKVIKFIGSLNFESGLIPDQRNYTLYLKL